MHTMERLIILIALFPAVFMIHEFEEIIMFKPWLRKNKDELKIRFPKFERFLSKRKYFDISTSAFAVAVFHEFILVFLVTVFSLWYGFYGLWFAVFLGFSIHLFVHISQWIIYKKYVPVIITSFLTLPYCMYTFYVFIDSIKMSQNQILFCAVIGIVLTILSFPSAFYFAFKFEKWKKGFTCKKEQE